MASSFVIANPLTILGDDPSGPPTEGYTVIINDSHPTYGIRMSDRDVRDRVSLLNSFIEENAVDAHNVLKFPGKATA